MRLIDECRDMPAAYRLADVVVAPSTRPEAFGRIAIEAQAMGRPIITTDHGGGRETVIHGATGLLVPPGDAAALAAAISQIIALDGASRDRLGRQAIDHVRAHFTNDVMCAATLAVYNELLSPATSARARHRRRVTARRGVSPAAMNSPSAARILVIKLGALGDFASPWGPSPRSAATMPMPRSPC